MKKRVITKEYEISSDKKFGKDMVILLLSDIHYSDLVSVKMLNVLKNTVDRISPDYICITGDIIDNLVYIENDGLMELFYEWLDRLGKIGEKEIPVLLSLGNHDMTYFDSGKRNDELNEVKRKVLFRKYYARIGNINKNVYLLDNDVYEDERIFIAGFTEPIEYFYDEKEKDMFIKYLRSMDKRILYPVNGKIKVALLHCPVNVTDKEVKKCLERYDLVLSGHMHNGLVLPLMDRLFKDNGGLISPSKKWFPKIARGKVEIDKDRYLIISGGIIKLSGTSGLFHYGNVLFPMNVEKIKILSKK